MRRGRDGVKKRVYYKGKIVGHVQEYSDTLLILVLKARRPEKFRENVGIAMSGKLSLEQLVTESFKPSPM